MKIVLDTNVLVSGLLSPFGPCGEIVRMVSSGRIVLLTDARILSEYHDVLNRPKFRFQPDFIRTLLDFIEYRGLTIAAEPVPRPLPDPDDEPFLEIALSGRADFLVTGNHAHFPQDLCQGAHVISPSDFIETIRKMVP